MAVVYFWPLSIVCVFVCFVFEQVKSAADYVRDANTDIEHAIQSSKSIRKRQCCMIIIVLIIIGIIGLVVYMTA